MKALLVHPGTQYSFRLAAQLAQHGCLNRFWTGFAYIPRTPLGTCIGLLPDGFRKRLANRRLDGVELAKLRRRPLIEYRALRRINSGCDEQTAIFERNMAFQRLIPEAEIAGSDVVVGFDTSSWLLAQQARGLRRPFLLDQSIGHPLSYQRLFSDLRNRFPEWVDDLPPRLPSLLAGEAIEHREASMILAASSFTRRTLADNGVAPNKIELNPYGVDLDAFSPASRDRKTSRPLRFIFVGSIGARKGVPLLLQAWQALSPKGAELWLAGPVAERHRRLIPPMRGLRVVDKVPNRDVPRLLEQCDVLVFPSYFEGFGLVLLEALAAGLPIIATDSTAAPDLIANGREGYVIPTGDGDALIGSMTKFLDGAADLRGMSAAARTCAERYSWDAYGDRWISILAKAVSCSRS